VFDKPLPDAFLDRKCSVLKIERQDALKGRVRNRSEETNEEIAIDLPRGAILSDGLVFGPSPKGFYYKVQILPERVIRATLTNDKQDLATRIKLGYFIGNRHLEGLVDGDSICIPASIGEEKIRDILRKSGISLKVETEERVIPIRSANYFAGEEIEEE
jgi:urease accessory protein UreE